MEKTLDKKLADIHANPNSKAFILADAKDADMAFGISSPGRRGGNPNAPFRSLDEYRHEIKTNVEQGLLDIMLMSVSTCQNLAVEQGIFTRSAVTPAIRANDTTDIFVARGSIYTRQPARPFRTALLDHALAGGKGANLGLFSMTFNNDVEADMRMLNAYRDFRIEAQQKGFRHFLEVFAPNAMINPVDRDQLGGFLNDMIVRALAGVPQSARPVFLKIPYMGPQYMEELVSYDRHLVPGVLGGSSGTTYDAFKLLAEARKHGARAALFGRKINNAEHQPTFIKYLRLLADDQIAPEEAVKAYHAEIADMGLTANRKLKDDMVLTDTAISYGGGSAKKKSATKRKK